MAIDHQESEITLPKSDKLDAVALLKADHRKVELLFEKFEKSKSSIVKKELALEICTELSIHATIEEEIFYPTCKGKVEDDQMDEAYVEHDGAKVLIAELANGSPDDDFYDAKMKVLSEEIKHHVKEEEKPGEGIFAQARGAGIGMDGLGDRHAARKKVLMDKIKSEGLPPTTRSFKGHKLLGKGSRIQSTLSFNPPRIYEEGGRTGLLLH